MLYWYEIAALLLSVLAGLGVGSGGIFLVLLTSFTSLPQKEAVLCNLYFFICALLSSSVIHLRHKRLDLPFLFRILLFGIPGVVAGRFIHTFFPSAILQILLGVFLITSGIFSFIVSKKAKEPPTALDKTKESSYNDMR